MGKTRATVAAIAFGAFTTLGGCTTVAHARPVLSTLPKVATVSERYQSYNIEMVEVTGGRFWAPYGGPADQMFQQRPPIDLYDRRLQVLARHLAPAFMRVSGTWANNSYFLAPGEQRSTPPDGFSQMVTPDQWRGVISFSKAVDAPIVTSFAASTGTRTGDGLWSPGQAQRVLDLTAQFGGKIYAAEFFNEPSIPRMSPGLPAGYSAAQFGLDFRVFHDWARKSAPEMIILGPGGLGEGSLSKDGVAAAFGEGFLPAEDLMKSNPDSVDAVSYHFYGSVSQRCGRNGRQTAQKDDALTPAWLDRTLLDFEFYAALRDKYAKGKPIWNTETAQAACGGSPWASTFLDSFRYLNQLGLLAQNGVQVVMHNTLAASDYGLLDPQTLDPRPNYWAAVLWRQLMGSVVLASPPSPAPEVRLFAHCLRGHRGGVALLALNTGGSDADIEIGTRGKVWLMTGMPVDTRSIRVNGVEPRVDATGEISGLDGTRNNGTLRLPAHSIAFLSVPTANNRQCRGGMR